MTATLAPAATPASTLAPRVASRDPRDFAMPTGREEDWRFTPLDRFARVLSDETGTGGLALDASLPDGVTLAELAPDDPARATLPLPVDRIAALAAAGAASTPWVRVARDTVLREPVVLRLTGADPAVLTHLQLVVEVEPFARATVVVEYDGVGALGEQLVVLVGEGAALELVGLRAWDDGAEHGAHVAVRLGRDARLRSSQVSLGGSAVRVVETVEYAGPGADAELAGLFYADAGQHLEHRLFIDHTVPHCRSNVLYKGALQGEGARSVWVGDVLVRAGALGTDTYEINRNLLLTDGARADSVPNLELETGDIVGAGHASATGRFDEEQLFYLQARGIPEEVARRLVVRGFFAEVLQRISVPELRDRLVAAIDAELGERGSLPADLDDDGEELA